MPGGLERGTTGQDHQHGSRRYLRKHQVQQLQGRGVGPVEVFDNKEDRVVICVFLQEYHNGFQGLLALTLW